MDRPSKPTSKCTTTCKRTEVSKGDTYFCTYCKAKRSKDKNGNCSACKYTTLR